jgi:hypothetical protein
MGGCSEWGCTDLLTRMNAKVEEDPKKVRDYVQSIQLFP